MKPMSMIEIYNVGKFFTHLYRSRPKDAGRFQYRYLILKKGMAKCRLPRSVDSITVLASYPKGVVLEPDHLKDIQKECIRMDPAIQREVRGKNVLLLPEGTVTPKLRRFAKLPNLVPDQKSMINEMETCIYAGAYRSAIVMSWNVLYDYARRWVFREKRRLLKAELAAWGFPPIRKYSDFFRSDAPKEGKFLDIAKESKQVPAPKPILGPKVTERMRPLLNERNEYAHANYQDPTLTQANHFVDCCYAILNNTPFV